MRLRAMACGGGLGGAALALWLICAPARTAPLREPGADAAKAAAELKADLAGTFLQGPGTPAEWPGEWPQFRGKQRSGVVPDAAELARTTTLHPLWTVPTGEGYAGAVIRAGRVYLLDYDPATRADVLRCLSLADGREIFRRAYNVDVKRNHGMSRTVAAITEQVIVTLGPKCHLLCADPASGAYKWGKDLVREYGTKVPPWYAGQCPLIDSEGGKNTLILAPAGPDALLVALDPQTGKELWRTPNSQAWRMTHASILPIALAGRRMYVYPASGGVAGVDARTGELRWEFPEFKVGIATVPTPVDLGEGRLLFSAGYGAGAMIVDLKDEGGKVRSSIVKKLEPDVFGAEQQTPVFYQGHIYGVIPGGSLVCMDREGNIKWTSGAVRFGLGPYLVADGAVWVLSDTGTLWAIEASPEAFKVQAKAQLLEKGHECWGPLALAGGRLVARDLTRLVCVDLNKKGEP